MAEEYTHTDIQPLEDADVLGARVSSLANRPTNSSGYGSHGLSATDLKKKIDEYPDEIRDRLNLLINAFRNSDVPIVLTWGDETINTLAQLVSLIQKPDFADNLKIHNDETPNQSEVYLKEYIQQHKTIHNNLTGRDEADAHPMTAITGLEEVLGNLPVAKVWDDISSMVSALNSEDTTRTSDYVVGQTFRFKTVEVPDIWITSIADNHNYYTYTSDAYFVQALRDAGENGLQVGWYVFFPGEGDYAAKKDFEDYQLTVENMIETVERKTVAPSTYLDSSGSLTSNTRYILGERASLTLSLPEYQDVGCVIEVNFSSGSTPCALTISNLDGFDFVPAANTTNKLLFTLVHRAESYDTDDDVWNVEVLTNG